MKHTLPPMQMRVALFASRGLSNKQIAKELGVSPFTVANHLKAAYFRLGINNRVKLVAMVLTGQIAIEPLKKRQ